MLIIPAIDLRQGACVRLLEGRRADATVYGGDPVEIALGFESEGARMIHVVNLDGAFDESDSLNRRVVRQIIDAVRIPVQMGGGLRSARAVEEAIDAGAARAVVGTLAVESAETLEELVRRFGSRIVVGIDARDGLVKTRGWERGEGLSAVELARQVADLGVERIIFTDIARDGALGGLNIEATCAVARACGIKVTASGGISSLEEIDRLDRAASALGVDSVIIGRAIYERRFTLAQALEVASPETGSRLIAEQEPGN